jgi:hypothetical protein
VVVIPPGVPHDFANVGDEPAFVGFSLVLEQGELTADIEALAVGLSRAMNELGLWIAAQPPRQSWSIVCSPPLSLACLGDRLSELAGFAS